MLSNNFLLRPSVHRKRNSFHGNLKDQLIYSCFLHLSANFHILSDEHDNVSWSAGFISEKKSHAYANARRWSRRIRAYILLHVRPCMWETTHACTCELTIERTRFSVSHRRLFPHMVLRHGSLFCSPSRPTLPRPNPYHIARFMLFPLLFFLSLFLLVFLGRATLCNRVTVFAMYDIMVSRRLPRDWKLSQEITRSISIT